MNRKYKNFIFFLFFLLSISLLFLVNRYEIKGENILPFETEPVITIVPELNISRFAPYTIEAEGIPETPSSVSVKIVGLNGDVDECWNYYVDGSCDSEEIYKSMTYSTNKYVSSNIYPDDIYPEIYFASSDVSWNNPPAEVIIRRNNYHILHFNNPFTMVDDMSFFIEFNAEPVSSVNSADLEVYLVEKGNNIGFFNENWLNDAAKRVELVGAFSRNSSIHHTHTANSTHRIVQLSTNSNGTIGSKELNIDGEFWIVLYSNSPNNNRGWNLRYHGTNLCNNTNRWYRGNQIGWSTIFQAGCPDAHIHIARRNINVMDGVEVVLKAEYDSYTLQSEVNEFFFGELPNLPPSSTSFISPTVGGTYEGQINISWNPATDPNNDALTYNVYLLEGSEAPLSLITGTSGTSLTFITTNYDDGDYSLTGEVCDGTNPCVDFELGGNFTISNGSDIQSIASIALLSSNSDNTLAKIGDTVTLVFSTSGLINSAEVEMYSGGEDILGLTSESDGNVWAYSFVVDDDYTEGDVTFTISSPNLDRQYTETTDNSFVIIDLSIDEYILIYTAGSGGSISGNLTQIVAYGSNGTTVAAQADKGFRFVNWSDGLLTVSRQDTNVTENISVTANFAETTYYINEDFNQNTQGWNVTHFSAFSSAFNTCPVGSSCKYNISQGRTNKGILLETTEVNGKLKSNSLLSNQTFNFPTEGIELYIPIGVEIFGPLSWDGVFSFPVIFEEASLKLGFEANKIFNIGNEKRNISFSSPVRLLISGQAGKNIGYILVDGTSFEEISKKCSSQEEPLLNPGESCKIDSGDDLIVWTTHFTEFVVYENNSLLHRSSFLVQTGFGVLKVVLLSCAVGLVYFFNKKRRN